jgi:hypothetical protein
LLSCSESCLGSQAKCSARAVVKGTVGILNEEWALVCHIWKRGRGQPASLLVASLFIDCFLWNICSRLSLIHSSSVQTNKYYQWLRVKTNLKLLLLTRVSLITSSLTPADLFLIGNLQKWMTNLLLSQSKVCFIFSK